MKNDYLELKKQLEEKQEKLLKESFKEEKRALLELKKTIYNKALKEVENFLLPISENWSLETCDYSCTNDIDGIDLHYNIEDLLDSLKKYASEDIIEAALETFINENHGHFLNLDNDSLYPCYVVSTCEDAFTLNNRDGYNLIQSGIWHPIVSDLHAAILFELNCHNSGVCGDLYNVDYYNNISNIEKFDLPDYLRAFDNFKIGISLNILGFFNRVDIDYPYYSLSEFLEDLDALKEDGLSYSLNLDLSGLTDQDKQDNDVLITDITLKGRFLNIEFESEQENFIATIKL